MASSQLTGPPALSRFSCEHCRSHKLRCNGSTPCERCEAGNRPCSYTTISGSPVTAVPSPPRSTASRAAAVGRRDAEALRETVECVGPRSPSQSRGPTTTKRTESDLAWPTTRPQQQSLAVQRSRRPSPACAVVPTAKRRQQPEIVLSTTSPPAASLTVINQWKTRKSM